MIIRTARLATLLGAGFAAASAVADVTIEQTTRLEGAGVMSFMNMSMQGTTSIAGDKSRSDTAMKMDSRWVRMFAGGGATSDIVRLDREIVYTLDTDKKRYTELSLAEQRAQIEKSMGQMREAQESQQQGASGVDESQCEWSEPETRVERTGARTSVAGYDAEQLRIVASQSCKDRTNPEQVCEFELTLDQWLSPDVPGGEEMLAFFQSYSRKLGLEVSGSPGFAQRAESMFSGYQGLWRQMVDEMEAVKGYPVKSSFALAIGGPQCADMNEAADAQSAGGGSPSAADVGRALGGSVGNALGGLFGRGKKKEPEPAAEAESPPVAVRDDGLIPLMTVSTEVTSVSTADVPADQFEVPSGFRKAN
jgi:hypothetical protein